MTQRMSQSGMIVRLIRTPTDANDAPYAFGENGNPQLQANDPSAETGEAMSDEEPTGVAISDASATSESDVQTVFSPSGDQNRPLKTHYPLAAPSALNAPDPTTRTPHIVKFKKKKQPKT
ncbi:unnamed protein product [Phytophthora fragariaefolia]|uniref:Unnamed protein product n=1 Tax=Phytophthora fragariaefolia TaxID=1490495 RepID=A0A9W7D7L9_9STRA|nr:unnamed protein product [Phytophthora fragariaefolia]